MNVPGAFMAKDEGSISTREAGELLGVSLRTVQLWVESGALKAWKTAGGHRRILRTSVEQVLAERRRASGQAPGLAGPFTMLMVDDEEDLLSLYRLHVESWGLPLRLVTASNGYEGLIRLGETGAPLLITDLNMPGMDGFRMIRTLKNDPDFAHLRIIAVTSLGHAEIHDRGGLPASVLVLSKPVSFSQLRELVVLEMEKKRPDRYSAVMGEASPYPVSP